MIKRYKISWTERVTRDVTHDQNITAESTKISELARRGKFTFVEI